MASAPEPKPLSHNDYTVGWVCALSLELTAATAMLEQTHGDLPKPSDDTNAYTLGSISGHNIVIAGLPTGKIGNSSAAAVAVQMIRTFPSIRFGLMVGIGGGIPPNVKLGDVVVSTPTGGYPGVAQYDLGKAEEGGKFKRIGSLNVPPMSLLTAVTKLQTKHQMSGSRIPDFLDEMRQKYPKIDPAFLWTDSLKDVRFKASCSHISKSSVVNDEEDEDKIGSENVATREGRRFAEPNVFFVRLIVQWLMAMWIMWVNSIGNSVWQQRAIQNVAPQMGIATEDDDCLHCDKTMIAKITPRAANDVVVHYGLIASGNQVVKDAMVRNQINKSLEGRALCIEMEAAGLMDNFPCMVIRGICDYTDSHKNDRWQKHAAAVAAAFARELLSYVQPSDVKKENTVKDILYQLQSEVQECREDVDIIRSTLNSKEDLEILDWLTPVNYGPEHSDYFNRRQPGTGQWLLETNEFRQWVGCRKQTLFCPGIPGSGKTMLTSIVINKLITDFQDNGDIGIAYLYCNFQWKNRQSARDLLSSVLRQLAQGRSSLPQSLKSLYGRHRNMKTRPSFDEISNTLHTVASEYTRIFVVIDALDECQAFGGCRDRVLEEMFTLQARCEASLFATSRDIPEITVRFNESMRVEIRAKKEDVRQYIEGQIDHHMPRLLKEIKKFPQLKEEIITGITDAVDGMFLLAQIYLRLLDDKLTPKKIKEALAEFQRQASREGQKGKQLADAYDQTITRIMEQEQGYRELAREALEWIISTEEPLTIIALQHALAVEENATKLSDDNFTDTNLIISVCGGLVTVNEQTNIIRLAHYTIQEYFEQARGTWFPEDQFNITRACIVYISFSDFGSGDCSSLSQDLVKEQLDTYPFYKYAIGHWGHHARKSSRSGRLVQEFLQCPTKVVSASQALRIVRNKFLSPYEWEPTSSNGLHLAAAFGLHEMVALLQHLGLSARDRTGREPLTIAAEAGEAVFVKTLLNTGRVNAGSRDERGRTALSLAAENGHESTVKLLLETDQVDVNSKDEEGQTPLHWATIRKREAIVGLLLAAGQVDVDSKDGNGRTPLSRAAGHDAETIVKLLLKTRQVDIDSKDNDGQTPLSWAARYGAEMSAKLLLETGQVDVNSKDNTGQTPFGWAVQSYGMTTSLLLIAGKAEVNFEGKMSQTPLGWMARALETTIRLLLEISQVDVDSKDNDGRTPLSWAAEKGAEMIVRLLLATGRVDIDSKDNDGRTPLSWAAAGRRHGAIVILLLESGADIESKDSFGQTPLHWASRRGHEEAVRLLLESGANVNWEDKDGDPNWGVHEACVKLLRDCQAAQDNEARVLGSI